jgi:hypothetical protein
MVLRVVSGRVAAGPDLDRVLTRAFPPEAVDAAVDAAGVREQWRRLLQPDTRGTITWEADSPGGLMEAWLNFTRWLIKHRRH